MRCARPTSFRLGINILRRYVFRRTQVSGSVLILLLVAAGLVGCGTSVEGKYVNETRAWESYIELNVDGTCVRTFVGIPLDCTWEVKGDELWLDTPSFPFASPIILSIEGDKLIEGMGGEYMKK